MGVVELERDLVGEQLPDLAVAHAESVHDVAHRAGDQEVLLRQTQSAPGLDVVRRVEHPVDRLDPLAFRHRLHEVALGEDLEVELATPPRVPQPQERRGVGAVAGDQHVVGHPVDLAPVGPGRSMGAAFFRRAPVDPAAESDRHRAVGALDLPREAFLEPGVRMLDLPAVVELLAEHPVVVAQAVAVGGVVESRERVQEAGGEPAEAAVAETGVGLLVDDGVEVEAELLHRLAGGVEEPGGDQVVAQQPAEQVLHRQVVDHLRPGRVIGAAGEDLAVDDGLAHGPPERHQMIGGPRLTQLETAGVTEEVEEPVAKLVSGGLIEMDFRKHESPFSKLNGNTLPSASNADRAPKGESEFSVFNSRILNS